MVSVILLMAGKGTRMGHYENKLLLKANNKYLFEYPLELFEKYGFEIICVISKEDEEKILPIIQHRCKYVYGGKERGNSVYNGLQAVTNDYVIVHDGARCLISDKVIDEIMQKRNDNSAILSYMKVKDTIKEIRDGKLVTLNRSSLIAASTPQCAPYSIIMDSYTKAIKDNYLSTDDISLIEKYHPECKIELVEANEEDFKVTTPLDYTLLKTILGGNHD